MSRRPRSSLFVLFILFSKWVLSNLTRFLFPFLKKLSPYSIFTLNLKMLNLIPLVNKKCFFSNFWIFIKPLDLTQIYFVNCILCLYWVYYKNWARLLGHKVFVSLYVTKLWVGTFYTICTVKVSNPLMHGRISDSYFKMLWGGLKLFFSFFLMSESATNSCERSRIFRYGLFKDILSKGQKTTAVEGGGLQSPPPHTS